MPNDRWNGAARSGRGALACAHLSCGPGATPINLGRRDFLKDALAATAGLTSISVLGGCAAPVVRESADTIIVNARIATLNRGQPTAGAIAIRGDSIAAVGAIADLQGLQGPNTQLIDAGGRTVVPGLNDAHTHFIRAGSLIRSKCAGTACLRSPRAWREYACKRGARRRRTGCR